jgi:hypothetical protein
VTGAQWGAKGAVLEVGCWTSGRAGQSFAHEILASSGEATTYSRLNAWRATCRFLRSTPKADGVEETVSLLAIRPNNKGLP